MKVKQCAGNESEKSEMKILGVMSNVSLGREQVQSDSTRGHSQRQKGEARARIKALLVFAVQSICSSASQAGRTGFMPQLGKKRKVSKERYEGGVFGRSMGNERE